MNPQRAVMVLFMLAAALVLLSQRLEGVATILWAGWFVCVAAAGAVIVRRAGKPRP